MRTTTAYHDRREVGPCEKNHDRHGRGLVGGKRLRGLLATQAPVVEGEHEEAGVETEEESEEEERMQDVRKDRTEESCEESSDSPTQGDVQEWSDERREAKIMIQASLREEEDQDESHEEIPEGEEDQENLRRTPGIPKIMIRASHAPELVPGQQGEERHAEKLQEQGQERSEGGDPSHERDPDTVLWSPVTPAGLFEDRDEEVEEEKKVEREAEAVQETLGPRVLEVIRFPVHRIVDVGPGESHSILPGELKLSSEEFVLLHEVCLSLSVAVAEIGDPLRVGSPGGLLEFLGFACAVLLLAFHHRSSEALKLWVLVGMEAVTIVKDLVRRIRLRWRLWVILRLSSEAELLLGCRLWWSPIDCNSADIVHRPTQAPEVRTASVRHGEDWRAKRNR